VSPRFSPVRLQLGQEITYADNYSFRFGLDGGSPAYGLGAQYKSAALDYAYRSTDVGGNHQFSIAFRFGASVTQQKSQARARLETQVNDEINLRMDELEGSQITTALQEGDSLFARGDYDGATRRYESALLWDPGNDYAEQYLARSRYHQLMSQGNNAVDREDFVQGLFYSKQALELIPDDAAARAMITLCNERIRESQNSAELVNNLLKTSIDLYANRQFTKALSGFEELARLDPTNPLATEYRRKCLMQIDEAVQKHQRDSRKAAQSDNYDAAIEELEQALRYKPNDSAIKKEINELKAKQQDTKELPPPAVAPTPHPTVTVPLAADAGELEDKYKRGMQHFNKGQFDKAVGLFMEVWTGDPDFHDVSKLLTKSYLLIGMRLYSRDDYAAAIEVWKKALAIDPDNIKVKRYLSRTDAEFKRSKVYDD
jgi:tetratricopeptide (TPR) repeat protein